jgi:hypothetical protein
MALRNCGFPQQGKKIHEDLTIDLNLNDSRHEILNTSIKKIMELRKEEFPVALQAYEVRGDHEDFVAEQVVSTQTEADTFMSMYAGRLIKTREVRPVETKHYAHPVHRTRTGAGTAWLVFVILLVVLIAVGFATGWIQNMFGQIK